MHTFEYVNPETCETPRTMPRSLALDELAGLLGVLAHPDRIRLVELLRDEERDVNSLAETLELSQSRVSQHLSQLRAHRLVRRRKDGRRAWYGLENPRLARWLIDGLDFLEAEIRTSRALAEAVEDLREEFAD